MYCRALAVVFAFVGASYAVAQESPSADYTLHAQSTLVVVPVSVTDASNHFVLNLDRDRFALFEDGVRQNVTQFAGEDAPLSVGLLVDVSGSMGSKLAISQSAATEFLKTMNRRDEAFLVEFSDRAELVQDFTHQASAIRDKLSGAHSGGLTALLDAVHLGLTEMRNAQNPRKALLIISDGGENNSRYSGEDIKNILKEADVQIYSMGVFEKDLFAGLTAAEVSGPGLLKEISERTGGRVFPARSFAALPSIARRIGVELRNEYILAYAPSNNSPDGKFRRVTVTLHAPEGLTGLKARWRPGYYAPTK